MYTGNIKNCLQIKLKRIIIFLQEIIFMNFCELMQFKLNITNFFRFLQI